MLVTNTAIPPMRENKANTISALRTEKKGPKVKQEFFAKSWYVTKFVGSQHILFVLSIFHHMNAISFQDTNTASTVSVTLAWKQFLSSTHSLLKTNYIIWPFYPQFPKSERFKLWFWYYMPFNGTPQSMQDKGRQPPVLSLFKNFMGSPECDRNKTVLDHQNM